MKPALFFILIKSMISTPGIQIIGQYAPIAPGPGKNLIELPACGFVNPRSSAEIQGSAWGIQMGTLRPDIILKAAEIGVKWTRFTAAWPDIEKEKGVYNFSETDSAFNLALENGIIPFVNLGKGNPLYTGYAGYDDPKMAAIYGNYPQPPTISAEAMEAFLAYVRATVARYKDKIDYWEIWNEPNHQNYWGAPPDGKEYGKLLKVTAELIRSLDPGCYIIGGATAGIDPAFTSDFLSQGTADLVDIISYHNYGPVPEERIYAALELWEVISRYNPNLEIWQGECGYPSASSTRDYRGRAPWGENIQAKWLLRQSFTDTYYCKAKVSNYFLLANFGDREVVKPRTDLDEIDKILGFPERNGSRVRTWGVNEKCLLSNPELKPKPGFYAYQNLCAIWNESYQPVKVSYRTEITDEGVFSGIAHDDAFPSVPLMVTYKNAEGHYLVAWWVPWYMAEYLPELAEINLQVTGVTFLDPVMLDLMSGQVYDMKNISLSGDQLLLSGMPLADYPLVICEREMIRLK